MWWIITQLWTWLEPWSKSEPHHKKGYYYGWNNHRNLCTLVEEDKVWKGTVRNQVNVGLTSFFENILGRSLIVQVLASAYIINRCSPGLWYWPSLVSLAWNWPLVSNQDQTIGAGKLGWKSCGVKLPLSKIIFASVSWFLTGRSSFLLVSKWPPFLHCFQKRARTQFRNTQHCPLFENKLFEMVKRRRSFWKGSYIALYKTFSPQRDKCKKKKKNISQISETIKQDWSLSCFIWGGKWLLQNGQCCLSTILLKDLFIFWH